MTDHSDKIEVRAVFHVPAEVLFRIFTDERDMCRLTRSLTKFENKEGGSFSFFDGSVIGTVSRLDFIAKTIVLQWRFSAWDVLSMVVISFKAIDESTTEIAIVQSGIPAKDKFGNVNQDRLCRVGWEERWLGGLASVLGLPRDN